MTPSSTGSGEGDVMHDVMISPAVRRRAFEVEVILRCSCMFRLRNPLRKGCVSTGQVNAHHVPEGCTLVCAVRSRPVRSCVFMDLIYRDRQRCALIEDG